jgi:hypothetical protein
MKPGDGPDHVGETWKRVMREAKRIHAAELLDAVDSAADDKAAVQAVRDWCKGAGK